MDRVGVGGLCGAAVRARAATGRARLMRGFFDLRQRAHAPAQELHNGGFVAYAETPARADAILAALGPLETPADRGEAAILAVHDMAYVDFLKTGPRSEEHTSELQSLMRISY